MASALVLIELDGEDASRASLQALNRGRRLASLFGASLYALVPAAAPPNYGDDDIVAVLSRHGADKVVVVTNSQLAAPLFYETHGPALLDVCQQLPPQLLILPASAGCRDIGPRLALDLGGYYVGEASIRFETQGPSAAICRKLFGRAITSSEPLLKHARPLVVGLAADDLPPLHLGIDEAELLVVQAHTVDQPRLAIVSEEPRPCPLSRLAFVVGKNVSENARTQLVAIARKHGAEVIAADDLRGQARHDLVLTQVVVGVGLQQDEVDPWALPPHSRIISVGEANDCPLLRVADYAFDATPETLTEALNAWEDGR